MKNIINAVHRPSHLGRVAGAARQAGRACTKLASLSWFVPAVLILVVVWESVVLLLRASVVPFWYDEVLTFHVSSLRPYSLLWRALQAGADGMPVGYYLLVQLSRMLPGDIHVLMRLPSLAGYILTLLGVYWFVGKRLPLSAGLAAVMLISLSPFREFALEARCYAPLVGFLAMAAVCWQRVDEKRFMTSGFALCLTMAVSCHHLAVVVISCFGIAELTLSLLSRRVRWRIWAACSIAHFPFLLGLSTLMHYREVFGKYFWSLSQWSFTLSTYGFYLGLDPDAIPALVLVALIGIAIGTSLLPTLRRLPEASQSGDRAFSPPELSLIGAFLFYPALLVVLTKLMTSGYTPRYGWPVILGLVLGLMYLLRTIWITPASAHVLGALAIAFAIRSGRDFRLIAKAQGMEHRWVRLTEFSRGELGIPVVIGSGRKYLEAATYAPRELRGRLVEVIDARIAARLIGADTVDQTNLRLARFIPLRVESLAPFQAAHERFLLYSGDGADWLTLYLIEKRYHLGLLSKDDAYGIYLAERPPTPSTE